MDLQRKLWLTFGGIAIGMALIACSCSTLNNILPSSTTQEPVQPNTNPPVTISNYTSLPYYDDFSNSSSGWDVYSSDNVEEGYRDGYYFLSSKTTEFTEDAYANKLFTDMIIEVDATPVIGIGTSYFDYGLSCRVQSNYDGYDFLITTDGYFAVYKYTDGGSTATSLLQGDEYQQSSAILQGYETNHLRVTCDGSHLKFEVNGVVLFDGQDSDYQEGDIRFTTQLDENLPNEIDFDNFQVIAP